MNRSLAAARTALIAQSLLWAVVLSVPGCNNPGSGKGGTGDQPSLDASAKSAQSIKLTAGGDSIPIGLTMLFNASVSYTDGTTSDQASGLTWTSSDPKVLAIDNAGLATAMTVGSAIIQASDAVSGATGSLPMKVSSAGLTKITLDPATSTVPTGASVLLSASGTYSDGTTRALQSGVTWTSTNAAIASVDASGLVTGTGPGGPVTISAGFQGQSGSAKVSTSDAALNSITVTPASPSIVAGSTVQLVATGNYSNGTSPVLASGVSWQSSNGAIASVDPATGKVTGMQVGTANISAAFGGQTGGTPVTVTEAVVESVIVTTTTSPPPTSPPSTPTPPPTDTTTSPPPVTPSVQPAASVPAGQTVQLFAYATLSDGRTTAITSGVTWTSSDTSIATVSTDGTIKGWAPGTATVTATYSTQSASAQVTVTPAVLVSLSLNTVTSVPAGTSTQLTLTGIYSDGTSAPVTAANATWSSDNTVVATVDAAGSVTGRSSGTATITASYAGQSASTDVQIVAARLTAIGVSPDGSSLPKGLTVQLSASGTYSDGTTLALASGVTWASSDNTVATVSGSGVVTGVAAGATVTVSASVGSIGSAVQVTVTDAVLQSVTVSPSSASVAAGLAVQLSASGTYSDGTSQVLTSAATWTSSNTSVATVTSTGVVSGVAAGSATITATAGGQSSTASITVTAPQLLSVSVAPSSASVPAGLTVQLSASGNYSDGSTVALSSGVTWSSSDTGVATVSSTGAVSGVASGSANITASFGGISSAPAAVTVTAAVLQSVGVSPPSASVAAGQTVQLTASGNYSDGTSTVLTSGVTWQSSPTSVATVDSTGLVKGVVAGTANVAATFGGIQSATATITVTGGQLQSMSVSPSAVSIAEGFSAQLTASGSYTDGKTQTLSSGVTWSSSNTKVATVSSSGLVSGRDEGTVTITASYGGLSGAATVTVTEATVSSISITPANISLAAGLTAQLKVLAGMSDSTALTLTTAITWTSDSLNVATVSSSGLVTGVTPGTARITATVGKNSDTTTVTVTAARLQAVSVSPASAAVAAGTTMQLSAKAAYSDGSKVALTSGVTWASSNTQLATVSSAGLVTGLKAGSVTIAATYGGVSGSSVVTVTSPVLQSVTVTPASASVSIGSTAKLAATGNYSDGTSVVLTSGVSWASSSTAVATVSSTGEVKGVAPGSATITASFGGAVGASIVTVPQATVLRSILITAPSASAGEDSTLQMTAYGVYSNGSTSVLSVGIAWTSSNTKLATVGSTGLVNGVEEGTVTISVRDTATGITGSVSVSITEEEDKDSRGGDRDGKGKGHRHSRINRWW